MRQLTTHESVGLSSQEAHQGSTSDDSFWRILLCLPSTSSISKLCLVRSPLPVKDSAKEQDNAILVVTHWGQNHCAEYGMNGLKVPLHLESHKCSILKYAYHHWESRAGTSSRSGQENPRRRTPSFTSAQDACMGLRVGTFNTSLGTIQSKTGTGSSPWCLQSLKNRVMYPTVEH